MEDRGTDHRHLTQKQSFLFLFLYFSSSIFWGGVEWGAGVGGLGGWGRKGGGVGASPYSRVEDSGMEHRHLAQNDLF